MRILGLDYGEKRIGVAVCDELGLTAQGLPTLVRKTRKHDLDILGRWIREYSVDFIRCPLAKKEGKSRSAGRLPDSSELSGLRR